MAWNDPSDWEDLAAAMEQDGGYYDLNADPYGVAQYMTPQMPPSISTSKWNYGQVNPYGVETMAKQGNAMQDYYKILSDPVTQWLNMATTGSASFDLNSLLGGGGVSPYIQSLQSSDDQYLQTIGQQLAGEAAPETVKLQMRQIPELADDPEKLKVYDAAVDNAYKDKVTRKTEGPMAQFEKLGLANPLQPYTDADLPGDVAADKEMINRLYGQGSDEKMQWEEYGNHYREAAELARRQIDNLKAELPEVPEADPWAKTGSMGKLTKNDPEYYTKGVELQKRVLGPKATSPKVPLGQGAPGSVGTGGGGGGSGSWGPAQVKADATNRQLEESSKRLKDYEARAKEAERYQKGNQRASVDEIVSGVNKIRAMQLTKQGRTPARDQARSMMSWLQSQNYG